ncbi:MAG: peptidase T [Eubacteriales bacterium]|nr:peptidase T [Eubacteriales bacterium]
MRAYERLLKYVAIPTPSDEHSTSTPTSACQFNLARLLADEMTGMGLADVRLDERCYVYAKLPATEGCERAVKIGFIAHVDTSPDFNGAGVHPRIIHDYDGGNVVLGNSGRVLDTDKFPHLPRLRGRTLIVTDGTSLLGADDKAGVAEIMTMLEHFISSDEPHGQISVCFTPDEEVGAGADHFDISGFDAQYAYTVDGGEEGEVVFENFNASAATFTVNGFNIHPGSAKDTMVNAQLLAMEINSMLPTGQTPRDTENYQGFYHLHAMQGNVERATLHYIVRDHSAELFAEREATLRRIADDMNRRYGAGTVELTIREQYRNMREQILPCYHVVENALEATREQGIEPIIRPIRGGTDGARLSYMGLPCPNLGTGGYAFHGPYEHITAEAMDIQTAILCGIARRYAGTKL